MFSLNYENGTNRYSKWIYENSSYYHISGKLCSLDGIAFVYSRFIEECLRYDLAVCSRDGDFVHDKSVIQAFVYKLNHARIATYYGYVMNGQYLLS